MSNGTSRDNILPTDDDAAAAVSVELVKNDLRALAEAQTLDVSLIHRLHRHADQAWRDSALVDDVRGHAPDLCVNPSPVTARMAAIVVRLPFVIAACEHSQAHDVPEAVMVESLRAFAQACAEGDEVKIMDAATTIASVHSSDAVVVLRVALQRAGEATYVTPVLIDAAATAAAAAVRIQRQELYLRSVRSGTVQASTPQIEAVESVEASLTSVKASLSGRPFDPSTQVAAKQAVAGALEAVSLKTPAGRCVCDNSEVMMRALYGSLTTPGQLQKGRPGGAL